MFSSPLLASTMGINYFWTILILNFHNMEPEVKPKGKFFSCRNFCQKKTGSKASHKSDKPLFFYSQILSKKKAKNFLKSMFGFTLHSLLNNFWTISRLYFYNIPNEVKLVRVIFSCRNFCQKKTRV